MKTDIILLCCLCSAACVSCEKKGADIQTPSSGNIVKEIAISDNDGSLDGTAGIAFSTDSQGRTIEITGIAKTGERISTGSYNYGDGIVTLDRVTGPARGPITYTMKNGRVSEDQYRCEKWIYNADGTLDNYTADYSGSEFENNFNKTEAEYRWTDGNITSCSIKESGNYNETVTEAVFKYTDTEDLISNIDINILMLRYIGGLDYLPYTYLDVIDLTGTHCRNLLESVSIQTTSGSQYASTNEASFSYESDDAGRLTGATARLGSGTVLTFDIVYQEQ